MRRYVLFIMVMLHIVHGHKVWAYSPDYNKESFTHSNEIVEVKIGDIYFNFPESFFTYAEDRMPIERDFIRIHLILPDFKPFYGFQKSDIKTADAKNRWYESHPFIFIGLKETGAQVFYQSYPVTYSLGGNAELQYFTLEKEENDLKPEEVAQALKPYMSMKPSVHWEQNKNLAHALGMAKEHYFHVPCGYVSDSDKPKVVQSKPKITPLVPRYIIEQGLKHKNQGFRIVAVDDLARYPLSEEVIQRLYGMAKNDKEQDVRISALYAMVGYNQWFYKKPVVDVAPLLVERFWHEDNEDVLAVIPRVAGSHIQGIARGVYDDIDKAKGLRLFYAMKILAEAISREIFITSKQNSQLSPEVKKYRDVIMDFYERPDVDDKQKGEINGSIYGGIDSIATPRYVAWLIKWRGMPTIEQQAAAHLPDTFSYLMEELQSNRVGNYAFAAEVLGKFKGQAKSAIPLLLPLLKYRCPEEVGLEVQQKIFASTPDYKNKTKCSSFIVSSIRQATADALGDIDVASPEVLDALYEALADKETTTKAGYTLLKLEPNHDKLMSAMIHQLQTSGDWEVKTKIILILEQQGEKAIAAVPILQKLSTFSGGEDIDRTVRFSARKALEKITGETIASFDEPNTAH